MKPIKKELYVSSQQLRFQHKPQTAPEAQAVVREFKVDAPAGYQHQNSGALGVGNQQGTIPAIVQYGTTAGEVAQGRRSACVACVAEGTLVFADGRLLPIEQIVERGAQQTFIDGRWTNISAHAFTGTKEIVEVTTTHGAKFRVTPDHRVMTDRGWVAACDLRSAFRPKGIADNRDLLDAPIEFELSKVDRITPDDAFLVGMLTGDGWISRRRGEVIGVGFCYAEEMAETWRPLLEYAGERLGSREQPRFDDRVNRGLVQNATQKLGLITWRNKNAVALGRWLQKDHVPSELWSSTPEAIGAYLTGLFSTDGSIGLNPRPQAGFYQTSATLISEVQLLLRTLGIYSTVSVEVRAPRYKDLYHLSIARHASLERFVQRVGFFDDHRQRPLEEAVRARKGKDKGSPERVRSVTPAGYAKVYDISVPGPDAFLANGVRVHNCKHFDNAAWKKMVAVSSGPLATAEDKQTLETLRQRVAMMGVGYLGTPEGQAQVDEYIASLGICRVLSDWVEGICGKNPIYWPVVPAPDATCPPTCHVGATKLDVVTPAAPLGLFKPRDLDAVKIGDKRYDEVMRLAEGKKP